MPGQITGVNYFVNDIPTHHKYPKIDLKKEKRQKINAKKQNIYSIFIHL